MLRPSVAATGYLVVTLRQANRFRQFRVHRLILQAFKGLAKPKQLALHNDGNKENNLISNLRWGTAADNARDMDRHGTRVSRKGCKHHNVKLTDSEVLEIRRIKASENLPCQVISDRYGVAMTLIWKIVNRKNWTHI